jgi:hypothetical protein
MSNSGRALIAIVAAAAVLLLARWLDAVWLRDLQRQTGITFDPTSGFYAWPVVTLAAAGGVLLLSLLAWRARSVLVGVIYAVVGGFLVFLPAIGWNLAAEVNGAPPILPQPIASAIGQLYAWTQGPANAVAVVAAGMLLIGLAVIVLASRGRSAAAVVEHVVDSPLPAGQPAMAEQSSHE